MARNKSWKISFLRNADGELVDDYPLERSSRYERGWFLPSPQDF